LRPLLAGSRTLRAHIDTWAGGWTLTAKLVYVGGIPADDPVWFKPMPWSNFAIGDPKQPIASSVPAQAVALPPWVSHAAVRVLVTGHGQGASDNCGEFCQLNNAFSVDGQTVAQQLLWRSDCGQNPIQSHGSWWYNRAGWCPGADVKPWRVVLGARPNPFQLSYSLQDYVNTCSKDNCVQSTCPFANESCIPDNAGHTDPYYAFSAVVIGYR
jgi:hypothetical protein